MGPATPEAVDGGRGIGPEHFSRGKTRVGNGQDHTKAKTSIHKQRGDGILSGLQQRGGMQVA